MFRRINVLDELKKARVADEENIISEIKQWLLEDEFFERHLLESSDKQENPINHGIFDEKDIFSLDSIRNIAIQYNLRFLDKEMFKDQIPYEAVLELKAISKEKNIAFNRFKILAPAERFSLEDENADPILFAELDKNHYLFIHKWGSDLAWHKKIMAFPYRNLKTLLISIFAISILFASLIPTEWLTKFPSAGYFNFYRAILMLWSFVVLSSITSYCWFLFRKDFSSFVWNSKYF